MHWGTIIISIGIFNGLMLSILFIRKKDHNFYLGFFLLIHSFVLLKYFGHFTQIYQTYHYLLGFGKILEWALPPLLYFYLRHYHNQQVERKYLHFSPILLHILLLFPIHYYKTQYPDSPLFQIGIHKSELQFWTFLKFVQAIVYLFVSWKYCKGNRWLKQLTVLYMTEVLALTVLYLNVVVFPVTFIPEMIIAIIIGLIINIIACLALLQSTIYAGIKPDRITNNSKESVEYVYHKVKEHVETHKIYLNQNFRLSDLSQELVFTEKQISQSINEIAGENINSFINRYRVLLAEDMLQNEDYHHYTIDAIAEECGFSNKVSFYKAFKKIHGKSPKEIRNKSI